MEIDREDFWRVLEALRGLSYVAGTLWLSDFEPMTRRALESALAEAEEVIKHYAKEFP